MPNFTAFAAYHPAAHLRRQGDPVMGPNISWNATPSRYQGELLLAALADPEHRIPSNAKSVTLDLMHTRQWIKEYTATGQLAGPARRAGYQGFTHFRLTHHGVHAAERLRCKALLRPHGPHLPETAVYLPAHSEHGYRDVVMVQGRPDADGLVPVLSARYQKPIRVPLRDLHAMPELPPLPSGELTDWWRVTDQSGSEIARVEGADFKAARTAAEKVPAAAAASRREGGLSYRRLYSRELQSA